MIEKYVKADIYADSLHRQVEEHHGQKYDPEDIHYTIIGIKNAFIDGWEDALKNQWTKIKYGLPEIGEKVLALTKNGKIAVTFRYVPKDCYGNVLGEAEWKGSGAFRDSIIAWMRIPTFDEILEVNKDVLKRLKEK